MNDNQKDQNVLTFMMQLVQQKYGDEVDITFLNDESNKLYDSFGDVLVDYFEPMLTDDQKRKFDTMIDGHAPQDQVLEFLMTSIPELDRRIQEVLISFRDNYINSSPVN